MHKIGRFTGGVIGLLGLAGISQLIKAVAGYRGLLPPEMVPQTLGGDL